MEFMFRLMNRIKNIGNIPIRTILTSIPTNHSCISAYHFNHPVFDFKNCSSRNKSGNSGNKLGIRGNELRDRGNEFRIRGNEFRVRGNEFRVRGNDLRIRGNKFRIRGNEFRMRGIDHINSGNDFGPIYFGREDCPKNYGNGYLTLFLKNITINKQLQLQTLKN